MRTASARKTAVATRPKTVKNFKGVHPPRETRVPASETQALIEVLRKASRDPKVDIVKMDWLLKARKELLHDQGEQDFNDAMTLAQSEMEPIRKDASNPTTRSQYATYVALDRPLRPIYSRHGFALSFDTGDSDKPNEVLVLCYVTRGRYCRTYKIPMPADGKGAKGGDVMTRTHATGSAVTYGRRYLLGMIFNIVIADKSDDDGNRAGGYRMPERQSYPDDPTIGEEDLKELKKLMQRADVQPAIVLELFGIDELAELTVSQCEKAAARCNKKLQTMGEAPH